MRKPVAIAAAALIAGLAVQLGHAEGVAVESTMLTVEFEQDRAAAMKKYGGGFMLFGQATSVTMVRAGRFDLVLQDYQGRPGLIVALETDPKDRRYMTLARSDLLELQCKGLRLNERFAMPQTTCRPRWPMPG